MNRHLGPALLSCIVLALAACGGALKYELRGTQLSPGSDARLEAKVDSARNLTQFELRAVNLTPPDRVLDNGTTYVVWTRRNSDVPWMRLGALELTDEGRAGSASLTVSEVAFDLLVSAEVNAEIASPSGKTLFEQRVQED
jgi:outer membrane lipopolysaccharide assembly protein LptE/RlpB